MKPETRKISFALSAVALACLCAFGPAHAQTFTVRDIRIEGIQRTEPGTVFNYLPVAVGDRFTPDKAQQAIKALYRTGFFKDVRIDADGDVLVVIVEERPAIASVEFTGAKEFDKEMLVKSLKEVGLGQANIYDRSLLDRAEQELKRQYMSRGLYGVDVTTTVTPLERNRVAINFNIDEGQAARIREIKFVGNKSFSDRELMNQIKLRTPGLLTWYTRADQYSKEKLAGDIEALKSWYQNNGFIEMEVESTQVSITTDKKDIYVTLNIKEGQRYTVSDIRIEGETFGRERQVRKLIQLKKGDIYDGSKMTASAKAITDFLGDFGYAFANVNPQPDINREKREVAFTFFIDPGKRVYVRQINIGGNSKTRDEVIRRELRQMEGSWYDGKMIKLSRDRVDRLGFFSEVTVETPEVPGNPDQVDVNIKVTEKQTGNILLGAGFSQEDKLMLSGSIQQQNFAGTGNDVALNVNTGKRNRTISLSQTNPYFTDDGVSRRYEVYYRTIRPPLINDSDYKVEILGASVKFGIPFTEVDRVYFGAGIERTKMTVDYDSPMQYQRFVEQFGEGDGKDVAVWSVPLTVAWQRDSRNSAMVPTKGTFDKVNFEISPFGDMKYYKASLQHQHYIPIGKESTIAFNGMFDYGKGFGGKPYPVFKNFYVGGIGTVRGFESSSIGPKERNPYNDWDWEYLGGSKRIVGNIETIFPFPGFEGDKTLRFYLFCDVGTVFADGQKIEWDEFRASVGAGISWVSPIGPLKLSYGAPIKKKDGDEKEAFQFQMGTGF